MFELDGKWIGAGIAYGPFRDGQAPGGAGPSRAQLLEDLELLAKNWNLIRMYGSRGSTDTVLELIREHKLPLRVVVGAWIAREEAWDESGNVVERYPEAVASNRREVASAIRLANKYPDLVRAVSVGNETQVWWSAHKLPLELLIRYVREVRSAVEVPVTTADDFTYWITPESRKLADEVDFLIVHIHPMWHGQQVSEALDFTREKFAAVAAQHPDEMLVLGETGWATQKADHGEQGRLIEGKPGEAEQAQFYRAFTAWVRSERIASFYFEAFDEPWKGGDDPREVEKHWGLYRSDRTPKRALQPE